MALVRREEPVMKWRDAGLIVIAVVVMARGYERAHLADALRRDISARRETLESWQRDAARSEPSPPLPGPVPIEEEPLGPIPVEEPVVPPIPAVAKRSEPRARLTSSRAELFGVPRRRPRVLGVILGMAGRRVQLASGPTTRWCEEGDRLEGWEVVHITETRVIFVRHLPLEMFAWTGPRGA